MKLVSSQNGKENNGKLPSITCQEVKMATTRRISDGETTRPDRSKMSCIENINEAMSLGKVK